MLHAVGIDVLQPDMQCYSLAWASYVPSAQLMGSDAVCASVVRRAARAIKQWSCMHACTQCVRSHALGVVHRVMRWGWADHMQRIIYLCRSTVWYKEEEGERERKNPKKKMGWWKVGTEEDGRKRHLEDCLQVARYSLFSKTLFSHCKKLWKSVHMHIQVHRRHTKSHQYVFIISGVHKRTNMYIKMDFFFIVFGPQFIFCVAYKSSFYN